MKVKIYLFSVLMLFSMISYAQTSDKKWNIGGYGGKSTYNGDIGNGFFNLDEAFYAYGAISVSRYLNSFLNLGVYGSYGQHGYWVSIDYDNNFRTERLYGDLQLQFNFVKKETAIFRPYIYTGVGVRYLTKFSTEETGNEGTDLVIPAGLGLDLKLFPNVSVRYIASFGYAMSDTRDNDDSEKPNDMHLDHSLGLTVNLGKAKDTDGDGVVDRKDKCPGTPPGALVDEVGCIIDRDKDGIADNQDACPDVAGLAKYNGCPDTDNDGIIDSQDECPTQPGTLEFNGCPDTDKDGIEDRKDDCPTVPGLPSLNGCPDTDMDGITDAADKCPTVAGPVETQGCPDRDKDGVIDIEDKCPDVPGIIANKGCPEIKVEHKQLFEKALNGIQFETGKSVIRKSSYGILDDVVKVMQENPAYMLSIYGHTDNVGADDMNMELSQKRATSVMTYLVEHGVPASRIVDVQGFGETKPIDTNDTPEGRAKNRRVEFKVVF